MTDEDPAHHPNSDRTLSTETAFNNKFWNNWDEGLYVDAIGGEPLFSSTHKYDSGSGWPSFFDTISERKLVEKTEFTFGMTRIRVFSPSSDNLIGYLFLDGCGPKQLRYCVLSSALRFIPLSKLNHQKHQRFLRLFHDRPNLGVFNPKS
jgi:methionine-R-sulfoxide reductase